MKQIINNHVHGSQLVTITNNNYSVDTKKMSGYGFLPKYEIAPLYSIVIEYEPRGGFWGLIFSSMKYFCPSHRLQVYGLCSNSQLTQWKRLFPWRYTLGWIIRGCRIRNERCDTFSVCHCTNAGEIVYRYKYDVCISATVNPESFYTFLKSSENASVIREAIENCVRDIIANELIKRAGNPAFVLHTQISSPTLDQAGYHVTDCRIQYNQNV